MPIRIPEQLPAQNVLLGENIFTMDMDRAANQDIRPLEVGILNLMPNKIETEVQLLRLLSNTPLQINVDLIRIDSQAPKNTPQSHMDAFYHDFSAVANKKYDGLIVTGAPLALIDLRGSKVLGNHDHHIGVGAASRELNPLLMLGCSRRHVSLLRHYTRA